MQKTVSVDVASVFIKRGEYVTLWLDPAPGVRGPYQVEALVTDDGRLELHADPDIMFYRFRNDVLKEPPETGGEG